MKTMPIPALTERQLSNFRKKYVEGELDECWNWLGGENGNGYSGVNLNHRAYRASRVAWFIVNGPIPEGLVIDHTCRNRKCVNPNHLEAITDAENNRRRSASKTTCPKGHPYTRTYIDNKGSTFRRCRECQIEYQNSKKVIR